jgi:hypothetical protein
MIAGPPCCSRAFETECGTIQFIDEDVDYPNQIFFADIVIDAVCQKKRLEPLATFDETAHSSPPTLLER